VKLTPQLHYWNRLDADTRRALLMRPAVRDDADLRDRVRSIVDSVKTNGDEALYRLTRELDGVALDALRVTDAEIAAAHDALPNAAVAAIDIAIDNVRTFHAAQKPAPLRVDTMPGVCCERLSHPLDAVGLYVPAGSAPLPSAAIMLCVPATLAGCPQRVLCSPPRADGRINPAVLVAASRAGVDEIFKLGGAQAIAAMAYGTESVPQAVKVFGPGNAWVTAAKSLVAMDPVGAAIDLPAGPSEVLVIADDSANAEFVAADLLSQAEHGPDSQVVLLSPSASLVQAVLAAADRQLDRLSRREVAARAIGNSRFIVTKTVDEAVDISNDYAPEHLIVHVDEPRQLLKQLRNAGSVFLGPWSPESVGDYCSGTNHVLPTYGAARSYSGLGLDQFMRHMTVQELTRDGLAGIAPTVSTLADIEGLDAHGYAVECRLSALET